MRIIDETGRVGDVTEVRERGVFAKPVGAPYIAYDHDGSVTGVQGAQLITATFWFLEADGSYRGIWADSRLGDFKTARQTLPIDG